ncbi:hypothetical protein L3Q82_017067 [Scortum barcoo]|uniref:Uncharacterized protein n=1 Tax=Scortum barcoo TaxID=214431 RepID=A0ACB8X926_9TELE|nr:hypothetical protein L3Q82_017067 [Scortum barcoo]
MHKQQQEPYPSTRRRREATLSFTGVNSNTWRLSWGAISKPTPARHAAHPGQLQSSGGSSPSQGAGFQSPSYAWSEVTFHVPIARVLVQGLGRRGPPPRLLPKPHCTGPSWTFLQVVSLLEGGPTSPFRAEPGRVPWAKTRPPGARLRAPTPGLAPGWGPGNANPGDVILILTKYYHADSTKVLESSLWRRGEDEVDFKGESDSIISADIEQRTGTGNINVYLKMEVVSKSISRVGRVGGNMSGLLLQKDFPPSPVLFSPPGAKSFQSCAVQLPYHTAEDALYCGPVEVCQELRGESSTFQLPEEEESLLSLLYQVSCVHGPGQVRCDVDAQELDIVDTLNCFPRG